MAPLLLPLYFALRSQGFLCGYDKLTGQSYEHRREWGGERVLFLGQVLAIDICAFAVMHNHHHVVPHIGKAESLSRTYEEVVK